MPWFVLYTKSHNEIKVANRLSEIGINVYCPTVVKERQWSDRKKKINVPLFKSYCFVELEEKDRNKVFAIPGVVRYLFWLGKPALVKQSEIDCIKNLLNEFEHDVVKIIDFKTDDSIIISSGVFNGTIGNIINVQGAKIMVKIESLNICISVDTSKSKINKLNTKHDYV